MWCRRLVLVVAALALIVAACFPQNCTPTNLEYCAVGDDEGCTGHLLNANTWESGPFLGPWISYGPNTTILFHLRDAKTGAPLLGEIQPPSCYLSPVENPNATGNEGAMGATNLCQFNVAQDPTIGGWEVRMDNNTCAQYYLYMQVTTLPGTADASTD